MDGSQYLVFILRSKPAGPVFHVETLLLHSRRGHICSIIQTYSVMDLIAVTMWYGVGLAPPSRPKHKTIV